MPAKDPRQAKDIKASILSHISDSLVLLSQQPLPDDAAIHDIRVMMKKQRAAVRLARPLLEEAVYNREYLAGRETGRILSTWRETAVLRKTIKVLKKENPGLFLKLWDNEKIQNLLRKPYSTWAEAGVQAQAVADVTAQLNKARYRLRFVGLKEPDIRLLLGELDISYRSATAAYLLCRNNSKPRLLHEFRKKCKTFMFQLCYFRYLNPSVTKSLEKKLDNMTQNLGKYNDLEQVKAMTGYKYGAPDNSDVANELAIVIRDKQDRYLAKVWPVAYRIFTPGKKLQDLLDLAF